MTYNDIADLQADNDIRKRLTACAALEGVIGPWGWVDARMWVFAAQPGWGDAFGYAVAAENPRPGRDDSVITDAMILAAVQGVRALEASAPAD